MYNPLYLYKKWSSNGWTCACISGLRHTSHPAQGGPSFTQGETIAMPVIHSSDTTQKTEGCTGTICKIQGSQTSALWNHSLRLGHHKYTHIMCIYIYIFNIILLTIIILLIYIYIDRYTHKPRYGDSTNQNWELTWIHQQRVGCYGICKQTICNVGRWRCSIDDAP